MQSEFTLTENATKSPDTKVMHTIKNTGIMKLCSLFLLLPLAAHATNALQFSGPVSGGNQGEYVQTTLGSNTIGSTFTLEAWVNPSALLDNAIVSTLNSSGMELHLKTDGVICFTVHTNDPVSVIDFTSSTGKVPLNKWTHVAVTFDGATVSMYVNGASVPVTGTMQGTNQTGTDAMRIGQRANGDMSFKGALAEVQVWSMVRSNDQIKADLNGYSTAQTGQLAYYPLDQGTAGGSNSSVTTATDRVGKYEGTLTNFVLSGASSNWVVQEIFALAPLGTGTNSDPYKIANLPNLYWLSTTSSAWVAYFEQTRNIDASSTASWNGGLGFSPIGNASTDFTGHYDGQGFTITGLTINNANLEYVGLFGELASNASIANVGLIGGSVTGRIFVGGLVGFSNGTVSASYATGAMKGGNDSRVGGLVGYNVGTVSASYATGTETGGSKSFGGGLVGYNDGAVSMSYATGTVTVGSKSFRGGLVGFNDAGTISKCYWDVTTSQMSTDGSTSGSTGKLSEDMKTWSTYTNWPFVGHTTAGTLDTWDIDASKNNGYPFHKWQYARLQPDESAIVKNQYNGTNSFVINVPSGLTNGDQVSIIATLTYDTKNVGTGKTVSVTNTLTGASAEKYLPPFDFTVNTGVITKVPLTITASDIKQTLGTKLPTTFQFTFSKFVNGEDETVLSDLDASLSCGTCKVVGEYKIVPTASAKNYELKFVNGKFTLNATSSIINRNVPVVNLEKLRHFDLQGRMVTPENP